jgi:hypothetical protein
MILLKSKWKCRNLGRLLYCYVSVVCVTNTAVFWIWWSNLLHVYSVQLVTTVHKSLTDTLPSSSTRHSHFSTKLYSVVLLNSDVNYDWLHSESELYYDRRSVGQSVLVSSPHLGLMTRDCILIWVSCLYSVSVSMETPVEQLYPRKHGLGFQESISTETCLWTRSLAMGLHVTILYVYHKLEDNWIYIKYVLLYYYDEQQNVIIVILTILLILSQYILFLSYLRRFPIWTFQYGVERLDDTREEYRKNSCSPR